MLKLCPVKDPTSTNRCLLQTLNKLVPGNTLSTLRRQIWFSGNNKKVTSFLSVTIPYFLRQLTSSKVGDYPSGIAFSLGMVMPGYVVYLSIYLPDRSLSPRPIFHPIYVSMYLCMYLSSLTWREAFIQLRICCSCASIIWTPYDDYTTCCKRYKT